MLMGIDSRTGEEFPLEKDGKLIPENIIRAWGAGDYYSAAERARLGLLVPRLCRELMNTLKVD